MESRTEGEVVKKALAILNEAPDDLSSLDIAERVELRLTKRDLRNLLEPFKDSSDAATPGDFVKIIQYFKTREERILATSLFYSYQPLQQVNSAIFALYEQLRLVFPNSKSNSLQLLLPSVKIPLDFTTENYNNFIVTEDGYLIDVIDAFEKARAHQYHYYYHPANRKDSFGEPERLGELDQGLLEDHSTEAWNYFDAINKLNRAKYAKDFNAQSDVDKDPVCEKAKKELLAVIKKGSCMRRTPAHGEHGIKRLMITLTQPLTTLNQLAELLGDEECVPREEWSEFLTRMGRDELCRIVLPSRSNIAKKPEQAEAAHKIDQAKLWYGDLKTLSGDVVKWPVSDTAKRALCFIMVFLMNDLRAENPDEYDSNTGKYFGSWLGRATSKKEMLEIAKVMMDFLLFKDSQGQEKSLRDFDVYLKEVNDARVKENKPALYVAGSTCCTNFRNKIIDAGRLCATPAPAPRKEAEKETKSSAAPLLAKLQ